MTAKHTPGPWTAEPPNLDPDAGERPKYHWTIHATGERPCISFKLAEISTFNGSTDESDARLISASPDLLQALITAERFMSGFEGDGMQMNIEGDLRQVRAAINKATGADHE